MSSSRLVKIAFVAGSAAVGLSVMAPAHAQAASVAAPQTSAPAVTTVDGPAKAAGWQKVKNGQLVYLKDGKCKSRARIHNVFPAAATAYSQLDKGKCWHWVKTWWVQPKTGVWKVGVAHGTRRTNFVSRGPAWNPARHNKGWYAYRAEFGLCGSKNHCVKKWVQVPKWGW
ncbi:hypothetical protein SMC26_25140 [Actinomadura fulvescens]|uniref:Secreted protein n=1 Tax=Actinomadura fulvescens TaxID=46160 RepID=A0ABN3Q3Q4_9ACTN